MRLRVTYSVLLALLVISSSLFAYAKKSKPNAESSVVDSGSFGIFKSGRRIATETFKIQQSPSASITASEIKAEDGTAEMAQTSELQLTPNGDLLKYDWRETKPEKLESSIDVGDQVLTQHVNPGEKQKPQDIPFILPSSTSVLDDYFFVHREIITWKYVASECPDLAKCTLTKANIGIIIPRQHTSGMVSIEFKGRDTTQFHGAETALNHFILHADDVDWSLYLNDQHKLVKVEVPSEQIEAIRD